MSKLFVDEVVKRDGNPAYDLTITGKNNTAIITGITWHTSYNTTTQDLGSLSSYVTSNCMAVRILHRYQHGGSTNHGYLEGYLFKKAQRIRQQVVIPIRHTMIGITTYRQYHK